MSQTPPDPLAVQFGIVESLQRRGWAVFPVLHGDKLPAGKWTLMSESVPTADMLQTSEWFGQVRNIGIACGPSNLVVVDEDRYGAFTDLATRLHQELPTTYTVETGKGRHFYFEAPDDVRITNSSGKLKQYGIDVRGDGGYVVAEGSLHPNGNVYRALYPWEETRPLPEWVIDMILERATAPMGNDTALGLPQKSISEHTPFTRAQAEEYLKVPYQRLISSQQGEQNMLLNSYAFALGHFASENTDRGFYPAEEAQKMCLEAARLCGYYFRDAFGADKTIRSGLVAGMSDPYLMAFDSPAVDDLHDDPEGGDPLGSWRPVDLEAAVLGTKERPEATVGARRSDGVRLLYPAREHLAFGLSEGGKSWFALACCADEMERGNRVLYVHFEEQDEVDTVTRMLAMGVRPDLILRLFTFVGPDDKIHPAVVEHFRKEPPALVILDGYDAATAMMGLPLNDAEGAVGIRRVLIRPFIDMGAAVLALDHVVKDKEARGEGFAIGSIHKINGLTGSAFLFENINPFGRGRNGTTRISVTKDRPGSIREHGVPDAKVTRKFHIADMTIDSTADDGSARVALWAPVAREERDEDAIAEARRKRLLVSIREMIAKGAETTATKVKAYTKGNAQILTDDLAMLVIDGRLREDHGPRNSKIYTPTLVLMQDEDD